MSEPRNAGVTRWMAWLGWGLFVAAAVISVLRVDSHPSNPLVHPEALYPAALYLDLDHWTTWNTPFSPYFFPDLPLFFLAMWLTGDAVVSSYAFAVLQVFLLIVGWRWLFRCILHCDESARRACGRLAVLAGAGLMLILGSDISGSRLFLPLFRAAFHTGALLLAVFGLALLIAWLDGRGHAQAARWPAAALFVLVLLGTLSDKLFLVLFAVPAAAAVALSPWIGGPGSGRRRLAAAAAIVAGSLLGLAAISWINTTGTLHIPPLTPASPSQVAAMLSELPRFEDDVPAFLTDRFFENLTWPYRLFWFLWAAVTLSLIASSRRWLTRLPWFRHLRRTSSASRGNLAFFALFTTVGCAATILATLYLTVGQYGLKTGVYGILFVHRYLTSVFVLPVVCLALYTPLLTESRKVPILEWLWVALLVSSSVLGVPGSDPGGPFPAYRHPGVDCLDEAAARHGAQVGLAFSFEAPLINVLSRSGLHADQVTRDFEPTTWIDDRVRAGDSTGYGFVLSGQLSPDTVVEHAGPPADAVSCGGWQVLFYRPPIRLPPAGR